MPTTQVTIHDSILLSIKKMVGLTDIYDVFDEDIITHINTAFFTLNQLGVSDEAPFRISGDSEVWSDYISDENNFDAVKTYIYMKVKLVFDPPASSTVLQAYKDSINEYEYRLNVEAENLKENRG